jgi:hypothetical protein
MKTLTRIFTVIVAILFMASFAIAQQQIPFEGYNSQGRGFASWNADGSGPEPAATGHVNPLTGTPSTYYAASLDYITQNPEDAGFHLLPGMTGFADFELSLSSNGYTPEDVTIKLGLASYEEDIEGLDWLTMGDKYYANHYNFDVTFELDGQAMLTGHLSYINHQRIGSENYWYLNSSFTNLIDVSAGGVVSDIAAAFLTELDGKELIFYAEMNPGLLITGNGRSGYSFNLFNGMLTAGNPTVPLQGLKADHEGTAAWDADGTGPEPAANGHGSMVYYAASVDYDGIDPNPDACLAHCLEGSQGFLNTMLQLQYRGFEAGDLKLKMGLCSFGPDVNGEDWGIENGLEWTNEYNNKFTIEINGEPILEVLCDTNKMIYYNPSAMDWSTKTSVGMVYNISGNASPEAQYVAQSFLRDLGSHYLKSSVSTLSYAGAFNGNGRNGVYYEIVAGELLGVHEQATFVTEGSVSGTWTAEDSPVYVDGHLTVENGQTLTIEPGVKVAVRGPYVINVAGNVKAEGTAEENIIFTRSNPNLWWDGFAYDGAFIADTDTSIFDHCIFEYGYAQGTIEKHNSGGIFLIDAYDNLFISNCTFRHNKADIAGSYPPSGGAFAFGNSNITIQKCIFYDNTAEYGGAILNYKNSAPIISNCLFYENDANNGGAISFYEHSNGILINNTFADNTAYNGGALHFYQGSNPEIINTVLWGNEATSSGNQVFSSTLYSAPDFYYCDIEEGQAGFGGSTINGGYLFNIEGDPEFTTAPEFPPYQISETSACLNQGTPDTSAWYYQQYLPATCLCGNPRTCNGRIEIGAYERLISSTDDLEMASNPLQIFPNPFVENLTISFELHNTAFVEIEVYNVVGAKVAIVASTSLQAGKHSLNWNSASLHEGIYFCRVKVGDEVFTQKIVKQ